MKFIKEGDKGKAICDFCGLTETSYLLRDVDFSDKSGTVKDILAGVCNKCDKIVSIPAQSTPRIKSEYQKIRKPLELRVPAHYMDILACASQEIDENLDETFYKPLITFYIHELKNKNFKRSDFEYLLNSDLAKAKSSKRLSFKLSEKTENEFEDFIHKSGIKSKSESIKIIILKINEDIIQLHKEYEINVLKKYANIFI